MTEQPFDSRLPAPPDRIQFVEDMLIQALQLCDLYGQYRDHSPMSCMMREMCHIETMKVLIRDMEKDMEAASR